MNVHRPIQRIVDLTDPQANVLYNMSLDEARAHIASGKPEAVKAIEGQFALIATRGQTVCMARSLGRPMRFFIAKRAEGPCLVVADRIDRIHAWLREEGLADQFHPSYTRMVPAHHILEVAVIGCPDPSPTLIRFFDPPRSSGPADIEQLGRAYVGAIEREIQQWLTHRATTGPIGVCFSGGIDSGAIFLLTYHVLLRLGQSPSRLKAFTLSVEGGDDARQASKFLDAVGLGLFLEQIEVPASAVDWHRAIRAVEDYKPLDIQAAAMGLALGEGIRSRYPEWKYLLDGDGGDENMKDYPIEDNPELTVRSVLHNSMLYQEGWGVHAIKHSLTYTGGLSRSYARTYGPASLGGFEVFSPCTQPRVIEVAESVPFIDLTQYDHQRLYQLKGDIVRAGIRAVTGFDMPIFEKRRFQHGAARQGLFEALFPTGETVYRQAFHALYQ